MTPSYKITLFIDNSSQVKVSQHLRLAGFVFQTQFVENGNDWFSDLDKCEADAILIEQKFLNPDIKEVLQSNRLKRSMAVVMLADALNESLCSLLAEYDLDDYIVEGQLKRLPYLLANVIEKRREESKLLLHVKQKHRIVEQPNEILVNLSNRILLATKEAGIGIWEYQVNENKFIADEVMLEQFELSPQNFTGNYEELLDRVFIEDREGLVTELTEKVLNYIDFTVEYRIQQNDGSLRYIKVVGVAYTNIPGNPACMIGTNQDITADKIAEQKVLLSEERFRSLVQNSKDLLAIIDPSGIYQYVSPSSLKILGYEPEHFVGKDAFGFIHEDDQGKTLQCLAGVMSSKHVVAPLFRFRNAAGEWRWIESTITNMLDDLAVQGIVVNSRDVTDRKIANDEIEKLSLVAKNTLSGVYILNKDARIQWVNEAFTHITGYTFEEAIDKHPIDLLYRPGGREESFAPVRESIEKNLTFEGERLNTTKSGKDIWVWLQLQAIFDEDGNVSQYFGVQTDITRQKELEEKVKYEKILKQKEITAAVYGAQEKERSEIGRELHDNVNQLLGAVRLYVNMARSDPGDRDSLLNDASSFALTAIEEIRKLSKTLITPHINEVGLVKSISCLSEEIMLVHPLRIKLVVQNFVEEDYNDKFKLNIFRICQEQLNNVLKHANATEANILIDVSVDRFSISISDNGVGLKNANPQKGVGITNIKSRSGLFNGKATLTSNEGTGTNLAINFENCALIHRVTDLQTL